MRKSIKSITDPIPESAKGVNAVMYDKAKKYFADYPAEFKGLTWEKQEPFNNLIIVRQDFWDFKELGVFTVAIENLERVYKSFQNGSDICVYKKTNKKKPAFLVMAPTMTFDEGYLLYWEL